MAADLVVTADGRCSLKGRTFACVLGAGGIVADKKEGDGGTPAPTMARRQDGRRGAALPD